ncbi:MAG: beta strand repeat-containing protein, partial [Acidobacteriaceae bacterium]
MGRTSKLRRRWKLVLFLLSLPLIAGVLGCGVTTSGSFSISLDKPTLTLAQGETATVTVAVAGASGFKGSVYVSVNGLPTGVKISPANQTIAAGASGQFTLSADSTAAPGPTNLTFAGNSGTLAGSTNLALTIQASGPPSGADFTFTADPAVTIAPGASGQVTLSATAVNGFNAPIQVALTGLPAGVTGPSAITLTVGTPQSVTLTVDKSAAPVAAAPLTFTATSGSLSHTATTALTIAAAPPLADFTFSATPAALTIVAGGTGQVTLSTTAVNGFNAPIAVSLSGLPAGVTASPSTIALTAGKPLTVTLSVGRSAAAVSGAVLTFTATSGSLSHVAKIALTVTTAPDFTISTNPSSLTVTSGSTGKALVAIGAVSGFTGSVNIAITGLPLGVTVTPANTTVSIGTPQAITFTVAPGTYSPPSVITITGTFTDPSGTITHQANLVLNIVAPPPVPDFSLDLAPTSLSIAQGASSTTAISLTGINGFAGTATVTPGTLPAGVTITPVSASLTAGTPQTLTVNVDATAVAGTYTILLNGVSGSLTHAVGLTLTVTASATGPDFSLSLVPSSLSVAQGASGQTTLSASAVNGFTGTINVTATGLPAGVTILPATITLTPGTSQILTVNVDATAALGSTPITFTGVSGSLSHPVVLNLTVTQATTAPDFTLAASPNAQAVEQGATSLPSTVSVTALNGYTNTVSITVAGLPAGVTASPSTFTLVPGTSQPIVFSADPSAAPGTYTVLLTGSDGTVTHGATLDLTVTVPPPPQDFTIALTPSAQTITQGLTGAPVSVAVTGINGFTSDVTVTLAGLPAGVTATPSTLTITPGTPQTVAFSVAASTVAGPYTIAFTGRSGSTNHEADLSLTVTAPLAPAFDVLTYHYDAMRSGVNPNESTLTTSNVKSATFGKIGFDAVDGKVDAQPLYVSALTIGGAQHNVLYVATEHGSVYAFDADNGALLKQTSLLGVNEIPSDDRGCGQITPEIGITSTPVIDRTQGANGTIFLVAMSKDSSTPPNYHQRLHALDLATLAELGGGPAEITATYPGNGVTSVGGVNTFDPAQYAERASLLLQNGNIYLGWTSHCDHPSYTGWVMAYSETTLQQTSVLNLTPNGSDGSVWMSGGGLAGDASGNVYLLDANGTFDTTLDTNGFPNLQDYGNSFLKLSTTGGKLAVADYFEPKNGPAESATDTDLGSGGILLIDIPLSKTLTVQWAIGAGKNGNVYVVDRTKLGKYDPAKDHIVGILPTPLPHGAWSSPAYFNGVVYYGGVGDNLKGFTLLSKGPPPPPMQSATTFPYPGATPSVSANGTASGIVWALESGEGAPAVLHAYDAANLTELYNSNQASSNRDSFGNGNKFITPMIV